MDGEENKNMFAEQESEKRFTSQNKQNNPNKNIIGIVILIIVLAAGGYFVFKNKTVKESKENKELHLQEKTGEIVKTNNFNQCDTINDATYKTVCVNNIALNLAKEKQDILYCGKIDDKLIPRSDCERQVIFAKSLENEDIGVCKETKNEKLQKQCEESFYTQLALKKDDVKVCDLIAEKGKADSCYNNFLITKNFTKDSKNFECSLLKGSGEREDCKILKKENINTVCSQLKTNLFLSYCFVKNFKR